MQEHDAGGESSPALARLRSRIDSVDADLIDLIATRLELAREAVAVREASGLTGEDLAWEAAVVRRASTLARARGVEPEAARDMFWRLIGLSRWAAAQMAGPGRRHAPGAGVGSPLREENDGGSA